MALTRTRLLDVRTDDGLQETCGLWTRGGLEGVEVIIDDKRISIPRDAILELVADEYVSKQIARLKQLTTVDAVNEIMGSFSR
jgi:hypothetical protein